MRIEMTVSDAYELQETLRRQNSPAGEGQPLSGFRFTGKTPKTVTGLAVLILCLMALPAATMEGADRPPNVVLILTDDSGYEVFGCYGSKQYRTPRIDRLAETGMRFNHCYANPVCVPSRVKIMTGRSNVRNYVEFSHPRPRERARFPKTRVLMNTVAISWTPPSTTFGNLFSLSMVRTRSLLTKMGTVRRS
jgi:hypothetical protein